MQTSDLAVMDKVVAANSRLSWDGWDVVHLTPDDNAMYKLDGVQINGKWYLQKKYGPGAEGYTIPDRLVKVHG